MDWASNLTGRRSEDTESVTYASYYAPDTAMIFQTLV